MEGKAGWCDWLPWTPATSRVRIAVSDEGRGIAPEARDKVFQPFFTTKSLGRGTGLGLPIAYGIVKMHSGRIWFDSDARSGNDLHPGVSQDPIAIQVTPSQRLGFG